jgi:large subunit ribosomal protein L18
VHRTNQHIYAQIINDEAGQTLAYASDLSIKKTGQKLTKSQVAAKVGDSVANLAIKSKIKKVSFDRNYYKYHGRVKALAMAARQAGLEF